MENKIGITITKTIWRKLNQFELDEEVRTHGEAIDLLIDTYYKRGKRK
jgi:hypothetical protein